jgi:hypothetical protein
MKFGDRRDTFINRDPDNPIVGVSTRDREIGSARILGAGRLAGPGIVDFET